MQDLAASRIGTRTLLANGREKSHLPTSLTSFASDMVGDVYWVAVKRVRSRWDEHRQTTVQEMKRMGNTRGQIESHTVESGWDLRGGD